jgi:hypothetical protein
MKEEIHPLKEVAYTTTNEPGVLALVIEDMRGSQFAAATNAWGICDLIAHSLDVAHFEAFAQASAQTSDHPPTAAANASQIQLLPGRSPTEVAATISVGCLQLVLHLPLGEVIRAAGELTKRLERGPGPSRH